jgi:hypothetical protein
MCRMRLRYKLHKNREYTADKADQQHDGFFQNPQAKIMN